MNTLSRFVSGVVAISVLFSSLSVSAAVTTGAGLQREAKPIIKNISNSTGKSWANARVKLYADTLKYAGKLSGSGAGSYKKEVAESASQYLSDLTSGAYTYDITRTERATIENTVLSYQKDMTQVLRNYLEQHKNNDTKETGDIHTSVSGPDLSVTFDVERYRTVQSADMKNMEIDFRMNIRVTSKEGNLAATIDGNVMIIDSHLYVTLRDYTLSTTIVNVDMAEYRKILDTIKGKTYHQKLEREFADALKDSKKTMEMTEKLVSILETESLLTPVAKQGTEYVLMFRKSAVQKIISLNRTPSSVQMSPKLLLIPIDIRTNGIDINMSGYEKNLSLKAHVSRATDQTPVLTLETAEHGGFDDWAWKLSKTPAFWALAGGNSEYSVEAQATKNGATATVKQGTKTVGTARINSTGIQAWTYDMTAIWEDIHYDWETGNSMSEELTLRLWGTVKEEFGKFTLTPPTLYEEMSKLQKQLEDL